MGPDVVVHAAVAGVVADAAAVDAVVEVFVLVDVVVAGVAEPDVVVKPYAVVPDGVEQPVAYVAGVLYDVAEPLHVNEMRFYLHFHDLPDVYLKHDSAHCEMPDVH